MTTTTLQDFVLTPDIVISHEDHLLLRELAHAGINVASTVADELLYELDRATVLPSEELPSDVVRMGSRVRYRAGEMERDVTLVFPAEADIEQNRVSVMTPVGAALIGLRKGQSITWLTRDGRKQVLTIVAVRPPAQDSLDPGPFAA